MMILRMEYAMYLMTFQCQENFVKSLHNDMKGIGQDPPMIVGGGFWSCKLLFFAENSNSVGVYNFYFIHSSFVNGRRTNLRWCVEIYLLQVFQKLLECIL